MASPLFNLVPVADPPRSTFDMSHHHMTTMNFGTLCPVRAIPVVPGDRWKIGMETVVKFQPMISPVMHRMDMRIEAWFVPDRIIWPNADRYYTGTEISPDNPVVHPYTNINNANWNRICDYFGIPRPTVGAGNVAVSALPFAGLQCIYDTFYRDQNLITTLGDKYWELADGLNDYVAPLSSMRNRAWAHDYFTSCLPFAQKGDPVLLPITGFEDLPVYANPNYAGFDPDPANIVQWDVTPTIPGTVTVAQAQMAPNPMTGVSGFDAFGVETSNLTSSVTINEFRQAYKIQEFLERAARGGTRYSETIRAHFGVTTSDSRLQRPELICRLKTPVIVSEVLNTTGTAEAAQGQMAGHSLAVAEDYGNYYEAEEHGYIIVIASLMPIPVYQNGLERHWLMINDRLEKYWPEFSHLGEQAILNREIHISHTDPNGTFGYLPRYAEYKFLNNMVSGDMREGEPFDFWTMARELPTNVALNQSFIEVTPEDTKRVFAEQTDDPAMVHIYFNIEASRLMPFYGDPLQL